MQTFLRFRTIKQGVLLKLVGIEDFHLEEIGKYTSNERQWVVRPNISVNASGWGFPLLQAKTDHWLHEDPNTLNEDTSQAKNKEEWIIYIRPTKTKKPVLWHCAMRRTTWSKREVWHCQLFWNIIGTTCFSSEWRHHTHCSCWKDLDSVFLSLTGSTHSSCGGWPRPTICTPSAFLSVMCWGSSILSAFFVFSADLTKRSKVS